MCLACDPTVTQTTGWQEGARNWQQGHWYPPVMQHETVSGERYREAVQMWLATKEENERLTQRLVELEAQLEGR